MQFDTLINEIQATLGSQMPAVVGGLLFFLAGWAVAILVRMGVRRFLRRVTLNERINSGLDVERIVATTAYFVVLLFAFVGFFSSLDLPLLTEPIQGLLANVFDFLPRAAGAGALGLIAWLLARGARMLTRTVLDASEVDEKISGGNARQPLSASLGQVSYGLVLLLFTPMVLQALGMDGLLKPVQSLVTDILAVVPNVFAAAAIMLVGWFVATLLREVVRGALEAAKVDAAAPQLGLGTFSLSRLGGTVVFALVLLPTLVSGFDALAIEAVSAPATTLLQQLLDAVPRIVAAGVILIVSFVLAQVLATLTRNALAAANADAWPRSLGLVANETRVAIPEAGARTVTVLAMTFATIEAATQLGFTHLASAVETILELAGSVALGGVIIVGSIWLASLVGNMTTHVLGGIYAGIARSVVIAMGIAMGLRSMHIAEDIVNLAFGLTLGALAIATALAFGLGGRAAAGAHLDRWLSGLGGNDAPKGNNRNRIPTSGIPQAQA